MTPVPAAPTPLLTPTSNIGPVKDVQLGGEECDVSATAKMQTLARGCGVISKAVAEEMPQSVGARSAMI